MSEFEQTLRELFGDSMAKVSKFQEEQMQRLSTKIQEIARAGAADEMTRLNNEINDLRNRVTALETDRVQHAAEDV